MRDYVVIVYLFTLECTFNPQGVCKCVLASLLLICMVRNSKSSWKLNAVSTLSFECIKYISCKKEGEYSVTVFQFYLEMRDVTAQILLGLSHTICDASSRKVMLDNILYDFDSHSGQLHYISGDLYWFIFEYVTFQLPLSHHVMFPWQTGWDVCNAEYFMLYFNLLQPGRCRWILLFILQPFIKTKREPFVPLIRTWFTPARLH